jgi:ubiquinone/menaquinone biosynthesis C-methylase UbiE
MEIREAGPSSGTGLSGERSVFEDVQLFQIWQDDYYHPQATPFYDRAIKRMLRQLNPEPGQPVLDAGCGPGDHSVRAAREGYRVVALDLSQAVLQQARQKAAATGAASQVTFVQGDLTKLDFADASFQAIFSWGVVIHIRSIERALDELARILKPGGRLALYVTNARAWDHLALRVARKLLGRKAAEYEQLSMGRGCWHEMESGPLWVWHIDIKALTQYLKRLGLTRVARSAGQFTELQRRLNGPTRTLLLWFNRAYSRLGLPPGPCANNLLIFEKCKPT